MKRLLLLVLLLAGSLTTRAQPPADRCAEVIDRAVALTGTLCGQTGRNQACYGNPSLRASPQPTATDFNFEQPGDIEAVAHIASLRLAAFDPDALTWGVALLKLQANLPDTVPGENVTMLLFGDVEVQNAISEPPPTATVTATGSLNIRATPSTGGTILGGLRAGDATTADGRLADSSWLRVQMFDGMIGWLAAQYVRTADNLAALPVFAPEDTTPTYRPMQAVYFRSSLSPSACPTRIDRGLILQTPGLAKRIQFTINGVDIQLGTTLLVQMRDDGALVFTVLKGQAQISVRGVTQVIALGQQVVVPMDENLQPAAAPGDTAPITDKTLRTLPFALLPFEVPLPDRLFATGR